MDYTGYLGVEGGSMPDFFVGEGGIDSWLNYDPAAESRGSNFINVEPSFATTADMGRKQKSRMWSDDRKQKTMSSKVHAAQVHSLSERKRREKMNQKMKALQDLIPRCYKMDKVAILDHAAEYIKSLQFQIKMMMIMIGCSVPPIMYNNQLLVPPPLAENLTHGNDGTLTTKADASTAPHYLSQQASNIAIQHHLRHMMLHGQQN